MGLSTVLQNEQGDLTNIHAFHIFYKLCSPSNHLRHCWKFPTNWEKYSPRPFLKMSEEVRLDTGFLTCGKSHVMFQKEDGKRCVLPNHIEFLGWEQPLDLWPGCELPEDACLNAKRTAVTCFFCFDIYSFIWKEKTKTMSIHLTCEPTFKIKLSWCIFRELKI